EHAVLPQESDKVGEPDTRAAHEGSDRLLQAAQQASPPDRFVDDIRIPWSQTDQVSDRCHAGPPLVETAAACARDSTLRRNGMQQSSVPDRGCMMTSRTFPAQEEGLMADVTVKRLEEFEGYANQFLYAGSGLGVTAFGMNVLRLPPRWADYPDHEHGRDGQEEVYVVLTGEARLTAGGESGDLVPGVLARVGATQKRKIVPGPAGATILALGGTPGKAYEPRQRGKRGS